MADQGARIDIGDTGMPYSARNCSARSSERQLLAMGENSRTTRPSMNGCARFVIVGVRAVVADLRIGEDDDLAGIGGVREDFLIAGDGGIEDDFAGAFYGRTKTPALEDRAVFQGENCLFQLNSLPVLLIPKV